MPDINISLQKAMEQLLDEYGDEVRAEVTAVLLDVGKETVQWLRTKSPKKTGSYAKGWRGKKITDTFYNTSLTVYNETDWQLTHLLNNGFENRNGGRDHVGDRHIDHAEEYANDLLIKKVEEKLKQ